MKRAVKRNTLIALLVCMLVSFGALCAMFGLQVKNAVFADTASEYTKPATFEMFDGAQVRKTEGTSGIRFITVVSNDYIAELKTAHGADNVKFGAVVLPEDMLGENELTVELEHANKIPSGGFAEENAEAGYSVYNSAIINIPETMYGKAIAARGYVAITGEDGAVTYTYTATTVKRSIGYVASMAHYVGNDTSSVVKGYVDAVAKGVTVGGKTEDTLKVALTQITNAEGEPLSYAIVTDPAGYAFKATSTNEQVVKVENGAVVPVAKAGTATVTVEFGTKTATLNLTVADYKIIVDGNDVNEGDEFNVFSADEYLGVSKDETKTHTYAVQEDIGEGFKPVTATVTGNENGVVDLTEDGVVKGGTSVGKANLAFSVGDISVGTVTVNGCAKITEIAHMDKLALVTWDYKNDVETAKKYLAATYVLGNDLDYAGQRILPIANVHLKITTKDKIDGWLANRSSDWTTTRSSQTFLWRDILTAYDNRGDADWRTVKAAKVKDGTWDSAKEAWETTWNFNAKDGTNLSKFKGSNPSDLPFTGIFDGNGYTINKAQMLFANFYMRSTYESPKSFYPSGFSVFGENQGTIRNINFEDLRYSEIYGVADGVTSTENVVTSGEGFGVVVDSSTTEKFNLKNNGESCKMGGFVMYNTGLVSDIKISFASGSLFNWDGGCDDGYANSWGTFGIHNNRGTMKNVLLYMLTRNTPEGSANEIEQLPGVKSRFGTTGARILYAVNYPDGVIDNCAFISFVGSDWSNNRDTAIVHYGESDCTKKWDNEANPNNQKESCTNGTITNCQRQFGTNAEKNYISGYALGAAEMFANWDITETAMTLKRGGLFN